MNKVIPVANINSLVIYQFLLVASSVNILFMSCIAAPRAIIIEALVNIDAAVF